MDTSDSMLILALAAEERGQRYVVCAAIQKPETGRVITGVRHYSPDMRSQIEAAEGVHYWKEGIRQGFVCNFGKFLTREEAWTLAEKQGQIRRVVSTPGKLYSENLY